MDAYIKTGAALNVNCNSSKFVFSRGDVKNLTILNTSVNSNGDMLFCGNKLGTVYSQNISAFGTDAIVIKLKKSTITQLSAMQALQSQQVALYPNPSNHAIMLDGLTNITNIKILNLKGQVVMQKESVRNQASIDMQSLNQGFYILQYGDNGHTKNIKFSKQWFFHLIKQKK